MTHTQLSRRRALLSLTRALLFWIATMTALVGASAAAAAPLVIGALTAAATFVLTLLFLKWERASLRDYGFQVSWGSCVRFAGGLLIGFALVAVQTGFLALGGGIHWVRTSTSMGASLLATAAFVLLATREELAFHGYPLRKLAQDIDPRVALIMVSIFFAVEHRLGGASWTNSLLGSGTGSLLFGLAALATRGLALPIGIHAAWNIGDWARGGKGSGGLWQTIVEPASASRTAVWAIASYAIVMTIAFAGLWLWCWNPRRRAR